MKSTQARSKGSRTYSKHGLTTLKQAVKGLGGRVLDMRTSLGKALTQWRGDLVADLGGRDTISTQQAAVIDLAVKTKLLLDSIDAWLLTQPSLVNHRKRALLPVVRERQQLADALAKYLGQLGLERRAKPVTTLAAYVATRYGSTDAEPEPGEEKPEVTTPAAQAPAAPSPPKTRPARQPILVTRPTDAAPVSEPHEGREPFDRSHPACQSESHEGEPHDEDHHDDAKGTT